jgi:hypothetical protein
LDLVEEPGASSGTRVVLKMEFGGPNSNLEARPLYFNASKSPWVSNGKRRKMNCLGIFMNIFIPWIIFMWVYFTISFKTHYNHKIWAHIIVGGLFLASVGGGCLLAYLAKDEYTPYWYKFSTLQCLIAIIVAYVFGYYNFFFHMAPYYDWQRLKTYPYVDASKELGQNLMDAGTVYFAAGTSIDLTKSWHFKTDKVDHMIHRYCVAPIVTGGAPGTGSFDFWAIGIDCCASASADFRCGDYANGHARSGLRLLDDWHRPWYKLAVQQAEAQYGIKAKHPLFFVWEQDPLHKVKEYATTGSNWYLVGIAAFFTYNLFAVSVAACRFGFIGRTGS